MTLNPDTKKALQSTSLLLVLFVSLFYNPGSSRALASTLVLPSFADFSKSVQNSNAGTLRGVYVDDVLALLSIYGFIKLVIAQLDLMLTYLRSHPTLTPSVETGSD